MAEKPNPDADHAAELRGSAVQAAGPRAVGDYDLVEMLARGNATRIWEVKDRTTGRTLAMKLLGGEAFGNPEQLGILKHEAKAGAAFNHPCVVRTHGYTKTKEHAYLLMDLVPAANLKSAAASDTPGTQSRVQKLVEGVCLGLGHMHEQGWLHLDVKPDNILLSKEGEVRVIDFSLAQKVKGGLAKMFSGKASGIRGTRTYIAPETILKQQPVPQTDLYSLGVTLYELLTGAVPFTGSDPQEVLRRHVREKPAPPSYVNDNLTDETDRFLLRLLAKKPDARPSAAAEVYAEFRGLEVFKEDPLARLDRLKREREQGELDSLDSKGRLDSRLDAKRTATGTHKPAKPKPKPKPAPKPDPAPRPQHAAHQPPPGGWNMPPGGWQMPPGGWPGYAMPAYGYGGGPQVPNPQGGVPQGGPQQPGMPPGYPPQPGQSPPQYAPPQGRPQPAAPQPPGAQPPGAPEGGTPRPAAGTPAPPAADGPVHVPGLTRPKENRHASLGKADNAEELEEMTELPDVL